MVTLPVPSIKTVIVKNKKCFIKHHYSTNDMVWWVDGQKFTGIITHTDGDYCFIVDEYQNQYIKSHYELYLDKANIIQTLLNENISMGKDIHNLKSNYNILFERMKNISIHNTEFTIEAPQDISLKSRL